MDLILSKPKYGWATVNLGVFKGRVSYLNDIAFEWLTMLKVAIQINSVATLYGDEEGTDFYIILDDSCGYVLVNRDKSEAVKINYNKRIFAQELCDAIRVDLEGWATFCDYNIKNKKEAEEKKENLLNLIADVQEALRNE